MIFHSEMQISLLHRHVLRVAARCLLEAPVLIQPLSSRLVLWEGQSLTNAAPFIQKLDTTHAPGLAQT